ncbi:IS3 family transposase [Chitinophaga sp. MAH-28]|uniref:IS3 family transposase n=2 Tax=Chitinophaga chungangae TaxID=2821488 RepID=A0ABS3YL63_9BACT|nr:IS3 family transposase [Chitinophaga chungangae]MBO9155433.1 IS3 family transposase [Chitinophaga chungangae]
MDRRTKFSFEEKLVVVRRVLKGMESAKAAAQRIGGSKATVQSWVDYYRKAGRKGLTLRHGTYEGSFKIGVIKHMLKNHLSLRQAAILFGIPKSGTIGRWLKKYEQYGPTGLLEETRGRKKRIMASKPPKYTKKTPETAEEKLAALQSELEYLRAENAYLKKLRALNSGRKCPKEKQQQRVKAIRELRREYALELLLKIAGMARSTYYYGLRQLDQPDKYATVKSQVRSIYHTHKGRYGYRRIMLSLRQSGYSINHKTVWRIMKECGLKSMVKVKKYRSYRGQQGKIAPNLLERDFTAEVPCQKWVTDVTEFNVRGKKLFLSPILDLYNGEIVSYKLSEQATLPMVMKMLYKAVVKMSPLKGLIIHSDQGWQYQTKTWQQALKDNKISQSMSRKGNCLDNAVMENFFSILKSELFYLQQFTSIKELKNAIDKYIRYYNNDRIKLKLKGLSPVQYRTQAA